jgi:circadian clock protein KaiB
MAQGTPRKRPAGAKRPASARAKSKTRRKGPGGVKSGGLSLRLYVAGNAPNSLRAVANAKAICEEYLTARYELEVIDLLKHPQRALDDGIIVTPTLLRLRPLPVQRVIGNLSDTNQVLLSLASK